ncbi:hypothetical protein Taro_057027 [Colocasia esculenta]|uniref:Uncharacterized protein n=1 Tax=Colocasia esculenta TaxID=4460 RepID=A0A843XVG5_COLES|nr:hypothetical protein [Colocasia esculenta]
MALEPCSGMFLLVLIQIWMLKWNLGHSKKLEIQPQGDRQSDTTLLCNEPPNMAYWEVHYFD